jgi:hypothetical protein
LSSCTTGGFSRRAQLYGVSGDFCSLWWTRGAGSKWRELSGWVCARLRRVRIVWNVTFAESQWPRCVCVYGSGECYTASWSSAWRLKDESFKGKHSVLIVDMFIRCTTYIAAIPLLSYAHQNICTWRHVVFIYHEFATFGPKTKRKTGSNVICTPTRLVYLYFSSEGVRYNAGMFLHDFSRKCVKPSTDVPSRKQMDRSRQTLWLLVRKRTILTERPALVGEVSANFCG